MLGWTEGGLTLKMSCQGRQLAIGVLIGVED